MARLKALLTTNWHFVGVVTFFLVHGYNEHRGLIAWQALLVCLLQLVAAGAVIYWIARRWLRQPDKAGLFTSFVLLLVLFFGAWQDALAAIRPLTNLSRLQYFLPLNLLAMVVLFFWLRKSTLPFTRGIRFINLLLLIYLVIELFHLLSPADRHRHDDKTLAPLGLTHCDTCARPPVYLVLLDGYFGKEGMQQFFQYGKSGLEDSLQQKGFHVVKRARSNYASTIYSMGSMLNMEYLQLEGRPVIDNHFGYSAAMAAIRHNRVCRYFEGLGYTIVNHSNFDLQHVPAGYQSGLLPDNIRLITQQTMYYRVSKYLPLFFMRKGWAPEWQRESEEQFVENNEKMITQTLADGTATIGKPVFTYVHLMMPHEPFAYDSLGVRRSTTGDTGLQADTAFWQYQVYTNKRISDFTARLLAATGGKAVILLMSDHGYRPAYDKEQHLPFVNLNAVYLPGGNYTAWYDGLSNVNQFRVLFNALYGQQLPMLKDSLVE